MGATGSDAAGALATGLSAGLSSALLGAGAGFRLHIVHDALVSSPEQAPHHVGTHPSQTDHAQLHWQLLGCEQRRRARGVRAEVVKHGAKYCAAGEDDQNNITVSGTAKVTGGTLKFRKAKGSLHFSGHYDRKSGAFNVTLTGSFTY